MLAGATGMPSEPSAYLFEPKWDGVRAIVTIQPGTLRISSRKGNDVTAGYPELVGGGDAVGAAVLDGEIVAFDDRRRPSFQHLQSRMHVRNPSPRLLAEVPVVLVLFDLLWLDGELLIGLPQSERRRRLDLLDIHGPTWQVSPVLSEPPDDDLLAASRRSGLEGYVGKRLDATYAPGRRSPAWTKIKCIHRREFVVGGWSEGQGNRADRIGSLAIGYVEHPGGDLAGGTPLRYVGQVGSGLSGALLAQLETVFAHYRRDLSPFSNPPAQPRLRFVEPVLVVDVQFTEVTREGTLRQPSLKGVRPDLMAADVGWDEELSTG
jgi:bifunctional non-homologous end joining protein LigD